MTPCTKFADLLRQYQAGERNFTGSALDEDPDNDLRERVLDGIDLSGSFVVASFRGASLRGSRFVQANVKTCDFRDADLSGADFRGAALCATAFSGAKMEDTDFEGAYCHGHELKSGEHPDW